MELYVIPNRTIFATSRLTPMQCRYNLAVGVPVEITAATILLTFWDSNLSHIPLYTAILVVCYFSRRNRLKVAHYTCN